MKITLLGSSHGDPTLTRLQSAALLETQGRFYMIDAGEGAATSLIRSGLRPAALSGIFVTHMHMDHCGGVPLLLEQALKYRSAFPGIDPAVRLPEETAEDTLRAWLRALHVNEENLHDIQSYQAGTFYDDGFIRLEALPTKHLEWSHKQSGLKSYGFKVSAEGRNAVFTGDLSGDFSDFPFEASDGADLLVSELVHFSVESAHERLKDLRIGKLVFTHLSNRWQDPAEMRYALKLFQDVPYPVAAAYDGMRIELH